MFYLVIIRPKLSKIKIGSNTTQQAETNNTDPKSADIANSSLNSENPTPSSNQGTNGQQNNAANINPSSPTTTVPETGLEPRQSCTLDINNPLYKTYYVKGTGPYNTGRNGVTTTCTYSDGRPPTITIDRPAVDEIRYVNVTATDYNSAVNVCKLEPPEFLQACVQVVMQE